MRITILGAGEVGSHLAQALTADGHEVGLIDSDPEVVARVRDELDLQIIEGHGGNVDVLQEVGVDTCDLFCAVTPSDELNVLASLLAKKLGARQTAVRIQGLSHIANKRFFYRKTLDFDLTISPEEMVATAISRIARGQDSVTVESVADGKIQLHRVELQGRFDAVGKKIRDIKLPKQCLIAALFRGTSILIPSGGDEVHAGDELLLIGATETLERVDKILGGKIHLPRRVMIVGGGRAGVAAAQTLFNLRIKVRILERSRARCEELSELLPQVQVEHADATMLRHLQEEHVEKADLFLALTNNDEGNLISCQIAHELGAKQVVALVVKSGYQELYKRLNVNAIVSPRVLVAERILRFVRSGGRSGFTSIERGRAEILEREVQDESPIAGRALADVVFPRGALVGAVIRKEEVFVPSGSDVIHPGDFLIVFALTQAHREVEALFQ